MAARSAPTEDYAWEKELAPKITPRRLIVAGIVYGLWLTFLAVLAAQHWLGWLS